MYTNAYYMVYQPTVIVGIFIDYLFILILRTIHVVWHADYFFQIQYIQMETHSYVRFLLANIHAM